MRVRVLLLLLLGAAVQRARAGSLAVVDAQCSAAGNCSAVLQAAIASCSCHCRVLLSPPGARFELERSSALRAAGVRGLTIDGAGALLVQADGAAPLLDLANCSNVTIANFTLAAARAPYTLGTVLPPPPPTSTRAAPGATSAPPRVLLRVNTTLYPMDAEHTRRLPWLLRAQAGVA